jgi:hypothetical protein
MGQTDPSLLHATSTDRHRAIVIHVGNIKSGLDAEPPSCIGDVGEDVRVDTVGMREGRENAGELFTYLRHYDRDSTKNGLAFLEKRTGHLHHVVGTGLNVHRAGIINQIEAAMFLKRRAQILDEAKRVGSGTAAGACDNDRPCGCVDLNLVGQTRLSGGPEIRTRKSFGDASFQDWCNSRSANPPTRPKYRPKRRLDQCLNTRRPVRTMAIPCSFAAAITSLSRTEPPG